MKKAYIFGIIAVLGLGLGFAVSYFLFKKTEEKREYPPITPDTVKKKKIKLPNGTIIEVPAEYILREGESLLYEKPYFPITR